MKPKLFLIDGTALMYRAYYAFIRNPLTTSKGENTSAIFGVINSFLTLIDKMQAEYIAISFDRKAPTFRHTDYAEYKANRPPMPDDLQSQIAPIIAFFEKAGVPQISMDGYEADDVLGSLGEKYKDDFQIVYVTSDKDYSQLLKAGALMYDPMKEQSISADEVLEKYKVSVEQFIDYLALVGDSSDNIPGVRGIGPKAAEVLLNLYPSLEEIYENLDDVPAKYQSKLRENRDNAFLSKHLATIVLDAEIPPLAPLDFHFDPLEFKNILELLRDYELISLLRRLEAKYPALKGSDVPPAADYYQDDIFASDSPENEPDKEDESSVATAFEVILVKESELPALMEKLREQDLICLDTETDALDPITASLVGISLCFDAQKAYYLPLAHKFADNLPLKSTLQELDKAMGGKTLIGHNLKYDLMVLENHGLCFTGEIFDTMLAAYILDAGNYSFSLSDCAWRELNYRMQPIDALIGKGKKQITFDLVSVEDACFYAAEDAWATYRLYHTYKPLIEHSLAKKVFYEIELPLLRVLKRMEHSGVSIDTQILSEISHRLNLELKRLSEEIFGISGYEFNLNSPKQLAQFLFEELKLPPKKKTKSGYSTDNSVLEALSEDYPIARLLIEYRQLMKLEGTYVSALPKLVNPATNRIHSSFNQAVASTGRLSSTNPNLQNIPIRTKIGREIRKAFIPKDDATYILAADYSQIELRLLALMSGDETLQQAFRDGIDIHRQTAAIIHNTSVSEVDSEMRRAAKTINFGLLYGMGQRKLARELGISAPEAKAMIENYFMRFPAIKDFTANRITEAHHTLMASTLFGRFLALPGINSKNKGISSEAERVAVNMPIQGTAADIIKCAMISIDAKIKDRSDIVMIMQVHDELVFEVHKDALAEATELIRREMENALPESYRDRIHLGVDIGYGKSWYEAH